MHELLKRRFLGTASFLFGPNDPPGGGQQQGDGNDGNGAQDDNDPGSAGAADGEAGEGGEDQGDGEGADGDGADDESGEEGGEADEEDDLAGLTPEQRAKVQARLDREIGWRDRQINKLYGKTRQAREDVRTAQTIVEGANAGDPNDPNRKFTRAEVEAEAQRIAATTQYDNDANAADAKGRQIYGDKWTKQLARIPTMGGIDTPDMVDILATDKPHVVLYSLASDPNEFERIMALPPARRRNEFVKLSMKPEPKKAQAPGKESQRPSGATPPVRPVNGGRQVAAQRINLYDDKADDDAWYRARNEQRRKKFTTVE